MAIKSTSIKLSQAVWEELDRYSYLSKKSKRNIIETALKEWLVKQNRLIDWEYVNIGINDTPLTDEEIRHCKFKLAQDAFIAGTISEIEFAGWLTCEYKIEDINCACGSVVIHYQNEYYCADNIESAMEFAKLNKWDSLYRNLLFISNYIYDIKNARKEN